MNQYTKVREFNVKFCNDKILIYFSENGKINRNEFLKYCHGMNSGMQNDVYTFARKRI